jgi:hypothetical protein
LSSGKPVDFQQAAAEASPASQSHADLDAECAMQEYQARS